MAQEGNLSCVLTGIGKVRYEDRPVPTLDDPHDVIIRISYVGVCGSDVHFWMHGGVTRKVSEEEPIVMGHEASGVVDSIGAAVTNVKPGDRVAIEPGLPCRRCKQCKGGKYQLCPNMKFAADPPATDGALSRYFKIPDDFIYKVPDSLSLQEAVLIEPLSVAVHAARLAKVKIGQTVLIQGSGTVGLLAAATAKAFGAKKIFISDISTSKLDFAKTFVDCATFLPNLKSSPMEEAERFKQINNIPEGVDIVLECSGAESSVQTGLHAIGVNGTFVQVGMGKPEQSLPILAMIEKETILKTAFRYGTGDYQIALDLLNLGKISVKSLISSTVPFENAAEAWERTRKGEGIKNLIEGVRD